MKRIVFFIFLIIGLCLQFSCKTKTVYVPTMSKGGNAANSVINFGAIPNDKIDDTDAIIKAMKSKNRTLHFPSGVYLISKPITVPNDIILIGSSNTTLKATKQIDNVLNLRGDYSIQCFQIRNFIIDADHKAKNCIDIYKASNNVPSPLRNLRCLHAREDGIVLRACQTTAIYNLHGRYCGGNGISIRGCNAIRLYGCSSTHNKKNGIYISIYNEKIYDQPIKFSGSVNIFGLHSEYNHLNGVKIDDLQTIANFYGGWMEGNKEDGFSIKNASANINGVRIAGSNKGKKTKHHAVHIYKGKAPSDVVVENCFISCQREGWCKTRDEHDSNVVITKNIHQFSGVLVSSSIPEFLGRELVNDANNKNWKAWYKSKQKSSNNKTPDGYSTVRVNPNMKNGGSSINIKSAENKIVKAKFYIKAKSNNLIRIHINPNESEPKSDKTTYSKEITGSGDWQLLEVYYTSKSTNNNIWIRNMDKSQSDFEIGKISVKEVVSFEKFTTEYVGNMRPVYKELTPEILR